MIIPQAFSGKAFGAIAAVALAVLWTAGVYALGYHTAGVEADLKQLKAELKSERDMQSEKDRLQAEKDALKADIDTMAKAHREEREHAQKDHDHLVAQLRAGSVRMSVPIKAASCPAVEPGASSSASGDQEARAELTPEAAATLETIATDGDQSIRDLNAVIEIYLRQRQMKCF